ncbi:LAGLIDADG family homing endonuclease [Halobacterium jilantaiense]|uniref:DNA helicase n=1 Tax=Halobacterium jilantaiense TaxID=355548 RepID=A0A1I0PXT5_9EURY|nr:LAGLIDADG family homing endonuclease [Halobacterium jilantaiense]SEW19395.1 replicative DNA helicase Mcm [Halobacterium jilantaiense]
MAQAANQELVDRFEEFYRRYYSDDVAELAREYPRESKSLELDWRDLYQMDPDLADDYINHPDQLQEAAEEALRLYDLPVDVSLGQAHVRVQGLTEHTEIRAIRAEHLNTLVSVQGMVRKATDVMPKIERAVFVCQRCGAETEVPQGDAGFQEPYQCESCERQGPFKLDPDRSEFVDSQKLRVQESPEGLAGGETPQAIDIHIEDDATGEVTPGDHVTVTGVLRLDQSEDSTDSPVFDHYMEGSSVVVEDAEFEEMNITEEDKQEIIELSDHEDIYEEMVDSMAPAIYGHRQAKLAMMLQLFSGVTKHLPDESRIRGDLHMLLIGDPGTGKCVRGDTTVTLADGSEHEIRELVESNLDDPKPVDDGVWDDADIAVPSLAPDGTLVQRRATKVWKREAPETMYRVRTANGHEVTVTPSHPLFVPGLQGPEAVRAEDLDSGQFVATPRQLETNGDDTLDVSYRESRSYNAVHIDLPDEWSPTLARLIGYVVAEGYVEQRDDNTGYVSVTNNDEAVLDEVKGALDAIGANHHQREPHEGKSAREVICGSGEFVSFLAELDAGLLDGSAKKRVPNAVKRASDGTKRAFLAAFVEGEGHVSATEREISVASTSRELLDDVRSLLLSLGITSQLHPRENGSYRLRISGGMFKRYVTEVGFVTDRKSDAAAAFEETDGNTNTDVVPVGGDELRSLRNELGLTQADCGIPRSTYQHYERGSRNPSRESLSAVATAFSNAVDETVAADGGTDVTARVGAVEAAATDDIAWDRIDTIEEVETDEDWVYDLEVEGTHSYLTDGVVSHNSQMISYVQNIAPRSVYTSGKGSSAAGLTAAAVRDDFGDGQQWTLEAGALVLADNGVAAVDELDKMADDDRSAMHEALEQQKISISKAGINATLKARCSLLGAANPKYGRFDQYEPIGEQIDLEPALISRFDLIFTVTDSPDPEEDAALAEHILQTNYAGELNTQNEQLANANYTEEEIDSQTEEVAPAIEPELLRKYIAYARRTCFPTMTAEAKQAIEDFYVDLRSKGADEDAPVPVTARQLEAIVRLAEASARLRLSDTVEQEDADRVIAIVQSCLQDIGVDPETGEFDADVVETGQSKTQRDRVKNVKALIGEIEDEFDEGAPVEEVLDRAEEIGMDAGKAEHEIEKLKEKGELYQPNKDHLRSI